ncbi:MAG: UDP-glucose 4-epimerase [Firmicutes bacterium]|nr:UDP-glucose 4-epimerase [Bacillota bacterium]
MPKTAIVTGCAGFIGSHLCEALVDKGWQVTGIDCFLDNYSRGIKEKNLSSLLDCPDFVLVGEDLTKVRLEPYLREADTIFHLASQPGVRGSWGKRFDTYIANNVLATQRLLEAAKGCDIKKFVYASSSSVYGNNNILPMSEHHLPKPFSPYGVTKMAAENLCHLYHENYNVPVISLRYFTVYGPRQRPDMAISNFISSIASGRPITIYGDGNQKRDFTYVDDIVQANILAAGSTVAGEVFNVGRGQPVRLIEVINMIERILGEKACLEFISVQRGDVKDTFADITKINRMLGFNPSVELEAGLASQIEYFLDKNCAL